MMEYIIFAFLIGFVVLTAAFMAIRRLRADILALTSHISAMKQRGIYIIVCTAEQATYVGSTKVNFHGRWGQHIALLNKGKHQNPRLQSAWNQYGAAAFTFRVAELIDDPDLIEARERQILEHRAMHALPIHNYNMSNSRVYPVASAPEFDSAPIAHVPVRMRRSRRRTSEVIDMTYDECVALGLVHDEIIAIAQKMKIVGFPPTAEDLEELRSDSTME